MLVLPFQHVAIEKERWLKLSSIMISVLQDLASARISDISISTTSATVTTNSETGYFQGGWQSLEPVAQADKGAAAHMSGGPQSWSNTTIVCAQSGT